MLPVRGPLRGYRAGGVAVAAAPPSLACLLTAVLTVPAVRRLAVLCGWRCEAKIAFDVGPQAFTPPPKVTSSVVVFKPRRAPLPCDVRALERVTQAAFGQRRKMLRQSLKTLGDAAALLEAAGIDPTRRAEEVPVDGFVALATAFDARRDRPATG